MLAPQYAVTAPPTDRVEIVVLRVALAAEPCIRVPASRASVAVSIPCALGPPDLRFTQCRVKGVDKTCQWGGAKVYQQRGHWPA